MAGRELFGAGRAGSGRRSASERSRDRRLLLLVASAWHAGFQLTVTGVVYPALADAPPADWAAVHAAHSRRITPLVAATYLSLLAAGIGAPASERRDPAVRVALAGAAGAAGAALTTACAAAPLHRRLGRRRADADVRALVRADRARAAAAVVGLAGAIAAALARP